MSVVEPTSVVNPSIAAVNFSTITVTWTPPQCPYGVISRYIVYYRASYTAQTRNISSSGYRAVVAFPVTNGTFTQQYITGLTPDTSYAVHVRAVILCNSNEGNCELFGTAEMELLQHTPVDITGMFSLIPT